MNEKEGAVITNVTSSRDGSYLISNLPGGNYTLEAVNHNYVSAYANVLCLGGKTTPNQNITLTPELNNKEIRIVLDWGASPSDLDSHITGPFASESGRFHVYYQNKRYNHGGTLYTALDHDVTNSYGPETVTIYISCEGKYRYSVYDYTNKRSTDSRALSLSNARVRVYRGSNLTHTFNVPSNISGKVWNVFEIDGYRIIPVNHVSFKYEP
jgi:hypothetical protein